MIGRRGARQLHLLPPGAGAAGDDAHGEAARIGFDVKAFGRVEDQLVPAQPVSRRPLLKKSAQITAGTGGVTADFARVYADAH